MRLRHARKLSAQATCFFTVAFVCVAVFVGLSIAPSSARAYRTAATLPEIPDSATVRWNTPIHLSLTETHPSYLSTEQVRDALEQAFAVWDRPKCSPPWGETTLASTVATPDDGENTVEWIETGWEERDFDPSQPAVTEIRIEHDGESWRIVEADIYINSENHRFTVEESITDSDHDLISVLAHELGHVIGLSHPCELESSEASSIKCTPDRMTTLMDPTYSGRRDLATDDESGLCHLYETDCTTQQCHDVDSQQLDAGDPADCDNAADAGSSSCTTPPRLLGQSCESANQCADGYCLAGAAAEPVCTRQCDADMPECPSGWDCVPLDMGQVCAPRESTSCSASGPAPARPASGLGAILLTFVHLAFRRRSRSFIN